MVEAAIFAQTGEKSGSMELPVHVFGIEPSSTALYHAVRVYLGNQRQGNASTKSRGKINATNRKPWRQKGTGRARSGRASSPVWRGGGIVFGPHPRSFKERLPRRIRRLAIRSALSARAGEGAVLVLDSLELPEVKTRRMVEILRNLEISGQRSLLVLPGFDEAICRASGNLPSVEVRVARELTAFDILNCERVVILKDAVDVLKEMYQ